MKCALALGVVMVSLNCNVGVFADEPKLQKISITLTVPSSAESIRIAKVYQTKNELWVLSKVQRRGGFGLTVISKTQDSVKVKAPKLPVKHFVLGKTWNWKKEKYTYLKKEAQFQKLVEKAKAKLVFQRAVKKEKKGANAQRPGRFIIMYHKNVFTNGKTQKGETLEQLANRQAKQFGGKVGRLFRSLNGCTMTLPRTAAKRLLREPEVKIVEEDRPVGIN
ncbi:MAG: hypothetical protein ACFCD0_23440 [Gemmataceae bacterium]